MNSHYNPLAVRVHPPVPASGVLHGMVAIFVKGEEISVQLLRTSSVPVYQLQCVFLSPQKIGDIYFNGVVIYLFTGKRFAVELRLC